MSRESIPRRRRFLKTIGAAGVGLGLAGCTEESGAGSPTGGGGSPTETGSTGGNSSSSGDTFKIGAAYPYSGDLAPFGPRDERGTKLALKEINKAKIKNKELEVSIEDTQTSPQTGVSAVQKLVNQEGVPAVIAACSSGVSMAIANSVTIPNKVFHGIPNSTSPAITGLKDDQYVWRTAVSDALQGKALAQMAGNANLKSLSIIMVNNDYGIGFANAMEKAYTSAGGEVKNKVKYESGKSSYKPQLNQAMEGSPEGLVFISYPQSFTTMVKQAFEMGLKQKVTYLAGESIVSNAVEQNVPAKAINGMIGTNPSPPVKDETYKNFASKFKNEFNKSPTVWAAYTYDAVMLTALAIQAADEFTSKALRDQVYDLSRPQGKKVTSFQAGKKELEAGNDIDYQGVSGSVNLNDAGNVPGTYRKWEVVDGKFEMGSFIEVSA